MALFAGQKTINKTTAGNSGIVTFNHSQNTGSNGFLVIAVAHNKANQISNIKYNNVQLTASLYYNGSTVKYGYFVLANPATGSNQVKVTFTGQAWNPLATHVYSFTGAQPSPGQIGNNDVANVPHSRTRTGISANSRMLLMGVTTATPTQSGWTIGGQALTKRNVQTITGKVGVGLSTQSLSAGSVVAITTAQTGVGIKVSNTTFEVLEFVATTPTLSISSSAISGMTYTVGSGPSNEVSFVVNGADLTSSVSCSTGSQFAFSLTSGGTFAQVLTLPQSPSGTITNLTVYVRLAAGLSSAGTYTNNSSITSTGATAIPFTLTGTVTAPAANRRIIIV